MVTSIGSYYGLGAVPMWEWLKTRFERQTWTIRTHLEVFRDRDQSVEDVEWLGLCGREGWPALTMDRRIRHRPAEIAAVRRHRVQAFALTTGNLTASQQAARFIANRARIETACASPGPFVYSVHAKQIVRIFPS